MKNPYHQLTGTTLLLAPMVLLVIFCNKKWDEPSGFTGPQISVTMTIKELRELHAPGGFEQITSEQVIAGIVVADDSKDNFYKSVVIQDSTAGITIKMDGYSLYNTFPEGSKLFIRLRGLWLGEYGKMLQLGGSVNRKNPTSPELGGIPQALFSRYLVRGQLQQTVTPKTVRIDELSDAWQSQLIRLEQVEFAASDTGRPYADVLNKQPVNHVLKACGGGSIYVRTSPYAKFAALHTPRGNGSITGIYTVYKTEKQLLIRDTGDVQMNELRCTGNGTRTLLSENFGSQVADTVVQLPGWKQITEAGDKKFIAKKTGGKTYAELSAFATGQPQVTTWLISPPLNFSSSSNEQLQFKTRDGYDNGATLQVLASTNYDGGNSPWKAKWTVLSAQVAKGSVTNIAANWVSSGNISLRGYRGQVYIAFRYEGADPPQTALKRTTLFQLSDITVVGN